MKSERTFVYTVPSLAQSASVSLESLSGADLIVAFRRHSVDSFAKHTRCSSPSRVFVVFGAIAFIAAIVVVYCYYAFIIIVVTHKSWLLLPSLEFISVKLHAFTQHFCLTHFGIRTIVVGFSLLISELLYIYMYMHISFYVSCVLVCLYVYRE